MGLGRTISALAVVSALISACNTTDAMIPRVGVGEDATALNSSPVTQDDTERMARAPARQQALSAPSGEVQHGGGQSFEQAQAYPSGSGSATLEEQADALRTTGSNPYRSAPLADAAAAQASQADEQQEADRRLSETPSTQAQQEEQPAQPASEEQAPQQQASLPPAPAAVDGNTIRFLPIIGAPVEAVTPLSRQLGAEARARGLAIKGSTDTSANYILKGYLSAFEDGPQITVSYVWDVLNGNGERLHRIQGNESTPLKAGDPWTAVPASVMQKIANETMEEFSSWRQTHGG